MSMATLTGGITHGFFPLHTTVAGKVLWLLSHFLSVVAFYFAQIATGRHFNFSTRGLVSYYSLCIFQLIITTFCILIFQSFIVTLISLGIGYITLSIIYICLAGNQKCARYIIAGIVLSLGTGFIFIFKISVCPWFNEKDISHLIMIASLALIYTGARLSEKLLTK